MMLLGKNFPAWWLREAMNLSKRFALSRYLDIFLLDIFCLDLAYALPEPRNLMLRPKLLSKKVVATKWMAEQLQDSSRLNKVRFSNFPPTIKIPTNFPLRFSPDSAECVCKHPPSLTQPLNCLRPCENLTICWYSRSITVNQIYTVYIYSYVIDVVYNIDYTRIHTHVCADYDSLGFQQIWGQAITLKFDPELWGRTHEEIFERIMALLKEVRWRSGCLLGWFTSCIKIDQNSWSWGTSGMQTFANVSWHATSSRLGLEVPEPQPANEEECFGENTIRQSIHVHLWFPIKYLIM